MAILHPDPPARKGLEPTKLVVGPNADSPTGKPLPTAWTTLTGDEDSTSPERVYEAALRYVESGLSVIPIDAEFASKSPDARRLPRCHDADGKSRSAWKIYQVRPPRKDEIRGWYEMGGVFGLAVLGGVVSGGQPGVGLEIIDFDTIELAAPWIEQVGRRVPGLIDRLAMVLSPRPGLHVYYRYRNFQGNGKLACAPEADEAGNLIRDEHGGLKKVTLIERKGDGGYCLVPPSPRRCHPRNRLYQLLEGSPDLTQVPVISVEEREILLSEAASFNKWTRPEPARVRPAERAAPAKGSRPGDNFDRLASWSEILTDKGWKLVGRRGDIEDWQRPGKGEGVSATVNYADTEKLYVFSTNAHPFEEGRSYDKFAAYALLYHGGDFKKAARVLQNNGFGRQLLPAGKR